MNQHHVKYNYKHATKTVAFVSPCNPSKWWNSIKQLQSWQKLMTHEELFMNSCLYAPSPLAMLIPELRKHAMSCANSSANSLTPIYYSVQPTLSGGGGRRKGDMHTKLDLSHVIVHCGTNNLVIDSADVCVTKIKDLAENIQSKFPNAKLGISGLT